MERDGEAMSERTAWQIDGNRAACWQSDEPWRLDLLRPAAGLLLGENQRHDNRGPTDSVLAIHLPGFPDPVTPVMLVDQYTRQHDLIVTYEQAEPQHLRAQIYYRASSATETMRPATNEVDPAFDAVGIQAFLSLQTDRLDGRPQVAVGQRVYVTEVLQRDTRESSSWTRLAQSNSSLRPQAPPLFILRLPHRNESLVIMAADSDVARWQLQHPSDNGLAELDLELFDEHLEKGVIRRAQLAVWRIPRRDDCHVAERLHADFIAAPPPLTT